MVAGYEDPVVQRRRLRLELRQLRHSAGVSQRDAARAMEWSVSKLIRIENGEVSISSNDLRALVAFYGVADLEHVERLVELARSSRRGSWSEFRDVHSPAFLAYLGYEASAWNIRAFETRLVPGLLQTEEYTRAVLRGLGVSDAQVERVVVSRQRRQEIHDRPSPPRMFFVLDEAVVRRQIGGPAVMRRQLERLLEWAREGHITLQVLPFGAGAHPGMLEPFILIEFQDPTDDLMMFAESVDTLTSRDSPEETGRYLATFFQIEETALTPEASVELLEELVKAAR